jgi:hypothetical protein
VDGHLTIPDAFSDAATRVALAMTISRLSSPRFSEPSHHRRRICFVRIAIPVPIEDQEKRPVRKRTFCISQRSGATNQCCSCDIDTGLATVPMPSDEAIKNRATIMNSSTSFLLCNRKDEVNDLRWYCHTQTSRIPALLIQY